MKCTPLPSTQIKLVIVAGRYLLMVIAERYLLLIPYSHNPSCSPISQSPIDIPATLKLHKSQAKPSIPTCFHKELFFFYNYN